MQSPYRAQLKVFLDTGTKTFVTLIEAAPMLKDMGINVEKDKSSDDTEQLDLGDRTEREAETTLPHRS